MKILLSVFLIGYLAFIWVLCRICTIADQRENFDDIGNNNQ